MAFGEKSANFDPVPCQFERVLPEPVLRSVDHVGLCPDWQVRRASWRVGRQARRAQARPVVSPIAREIFATANADFDYRFSLAAQDLIETVLECSPRRATRLWPMAFGFAAEGGRDFVTLSDIRAAKALLEQSVATVRPIRFISSAGVSH